MRVLISLPIHECRRVIEDQLRNLSYFFKNATIVLHLSRSYNESKDFSKFGNVKINPERYKTRWGNISYLHYANIDFALKSKIPFDYVVFCSSNELYFRKGIEKYLGTAKAFMDPRGIIKKGKFTYSPPRSVFYVRTILVDPALTDKKLLGFVKRHKLPGICKSQIEGSAYHRTVIVKMMALLKKEFGFKYMQDIKYCGEEILLPTVFLAVRKNIEVRRQFSFVDWCHDFTPGMWKRSVLYWRKRKGRLRKYFRSIGMHDNIYAIKGVKRTYFNGVRNYVRCFTPRTRIPFKTSVNYAVLDFKYNLRILKKEIAPRRLVLNSANWLLGMASRMIGKPKSYMKWIFRKKALKFIRRHNIKIG